MLDGAHVTLLPGGTEGRVSEGGEVGLGCARGGREGTTLIRKGKGEIEVGSGWKMVVKHGREDVRGNKVKTDTGNAYDPSASDGGSKSLKEQVEDGRLRGNVEIVGMDTEAGHDERGGGESEGAGKIENHLDIAKVGINVLRAIKGEDAVVEAEASGESGDLLFVAAWRIIGEDW